MASGSYGLCFAYSCPGVLCSLKCLKVPVVVPIRLRNQSPVFGHASLLWCVFVTLLYLHRAWHCTLAKCALVCMTWYHDPRGALACAGITLFLAIHWQLLPIRPNLDKHSQSSVVSQTPISTVRLH